MQLYCCLFKHTQGYQGKTPVIGDHQARGLLDSPKNEQMEIPFDL